MPLPPCLIHRRIPGEGVRDIEAPIVPFARAAGVVSPRRSAMPTATGGRPAAAATIPVVRTGA